MPLSAETISALLGSLYEAAASPQHWPDFFEALRGCIRMDKSFFLLVDPEHNCNINLSYGFDPAWQRSYQEHFYLHDVLRDTCIQAKQLHGEWVGNTHSVLPDRDYFRSVLYNDFVKPQGQFYHCAAVLGGLEGGIEGGITLNRGKQGGAFEPDELALLAILAPHLTRALNMHRSLCRQRSHEGVLRHTLETLDVAMLSLDSRNRVLRMTASAEALLQTRDGLALDRGVLRAGVAHEQSRLLELIAGAVFTGSGAGISDTEPPTYSCRAPAAAPELRTRRLWTPRSGGAMLVSRMPPKRPLQITVTPFCSSEMLLDERPAALVFLVDPDGHSAPRAAVLQSLYALTPTEGRLADELAQGCDIAAAAELMRITVQTARFHLKAVFRKTGVTRQAELVRLVLGLTGQAG